MWTDEYIAAQLLHVHLNPELDLASRKKTTILNTVKWILEKAGRDNMKILDLGCGPGLYCREFHKAGHHVTGVDFSRISIEYAKQNAIENKEDIRYLNMNYLELTAENEYDLITLIYTDFGVLNLADQKKLLEKIYAALKPGGIFIFDVLNDRDMNSKLTPRNWEMAEKGFWRPTPYLALSDSFLYEDEKVVLYQHVVLENNDMVSVYRFWTSMFSNEKLTEMLGEAGFSEMEFYDDVVKGNDPWNGKNLTFSVCRK